MRISDWSSDVCSSDLQAALAEDGVVARVQNAGVSGDTTAAGRQRLAYVLGHAKAKPALVLLGLGGNDMLRGIGPDQTRANLDAMPAELTKREIPVLLTGMIEIGRASVRERVWQYV